MAQKTARRGGAGVTIHDVARHAGVSPMTVSRVVNGEKNVRQDTRARVEASIEALRYVPNLAARSLASAESLRIALIYSNPSAAYLSEFLVGSLEQCRLSGCQLLIEKCDGPEGERDAIAKLLAAGADGVILPPPLCDSEAALKAVEEAGAIAVLVATGQPRKGLSSVSIDDFGAARTMTDRLIALGHRDIAFITGHPNQTASGQREAGFRAAMRKAGLSVADDRVAQGYFTYKSGLEAADLLLGRATHPTAVFASNDDMAAAAVSVAHRRGLEVPGDLTVVGFDDTAMATTAWPELTTVRQPIADMARAAVTLLLEHIRGRRSGDEPDPSRKVLNFTLVERESAAAPHPAG